MVRMMGVATSSFVEQNEDVDGFVCELLDDGDSVKRDMPVIGRVSICFLDWKCGYGFE